MSDCVVVTLAAVARAFHFSLSFIHCVAGFMFMFRPFSVVVVPVAVVGVLVDVRTGDHVTSGHENERDAIGDALTGGFVLTLTLHHMESKAPAELKHNWKTSR